MKLSPPLLAALLVLAASPLVNAPVAAQAHNPSPPDTRTMIDALTPATRSLRNLLVRQKADPESTAASAPVAVTALAAGPPSLSLAIQFELNSARVRPESGAVLGNLVAAMLSPELRTNRFVIEGHTDARGAPALNQQLSQQRADEVRLYLVTLGVSPARLKAVGKGAAEPVNPLDPMAAENRRVRVVTIE